jgi:segregation and condensation protein A
MPAVASKVELADARQGLENERTSAQQPLTLEAPAAVAVVRGEPVTALPADLYIPPDALQVFLDAFEGPLDLLLYLIKRHNLDILDIPIADITRQYMEYVELMKELQLGLAAEYLVMAAMLAEIKSRMLLPQPAETEDEDDPRAELVRRLQEYERFRRAAEDIDALPRLERDVFTTGALLPELDARKPQPEVNLQDLLAAFKEVLHRAEMFSHHHVRREPLSVRERMSMVLERLAHSEFTEFTACFRLEEGRAGVTVTLLAVLELIKERLVELVQAEPFAPIHLRPAGAAEGG